MVTDPTETGPLRAPFRKAARPWCRSPLRPQLLQSPFVRRNGQSGGCSRDLLSVNCLTQTRKSFRDDPDVQHRSTLRAALGGETVHTLNDPTRDAAVAANSRRRICSGLLGHKCCSPLTSRTACSCSVATTAALFEGNRASKRGRDRAGSPGSK